MNIDGLKMKRVGKVLGFTFSLLLFSVILYNVLSFSGKIPDDWEFWNLLSLTALLATIAFFTERWIRN